MAMDEAELLRVSCAGDCLAVGELLCRGVDPMARDKDRNTPLHLAALKGNGSIVELLLERGADPMALRRDGSSPLHLAAIKGHLSIIEALVNRGACIDITNSNGLTPLHQAICSAKESSIYLLLKMGADPYIEDNNGITPFHAAVKSDIITIPIIERILVNGIKSEIQRKAREKSINLAAKNGYIPLMQLLIQVTEDFHNKNAIEITGANDTSEEGKVQIIKQFLENGFDINYTNIQKSTLLYCAVYEQHNALVNFLLTKCPELEIRNNIGETPLHRAVIINNIPLSKTLIDAGAKLENINNTGNTCAHHAAFNGRGEIIELLLDSGFDVNFQNRDGNSMLHLAAREGHSELVNILISRGANVNIYNKKGNPPVILTTKLGYTDIMSSLLEFGADPYTKEGKSILHVAALSDRLATIQEIFTRFQEKINLHAKWCEQTGETCANAVGAGNTAWWLRKQLVANLDTETNPMRGMDYCKEIYEKYGSNAIERCKINTKREVDFISKSTSTGEIKLHYMDEQGNTMLHFAVESNNLPMVKALVDRGALLVAQNHWNQTPIDIAKKNQWNLLEFLGLESNPLDNRIVSYLYAVLLNIVAQTVGLENTENRHTEGTLEPRKNFDKAIQRTKLEAIQIVSRIITKILPSDPIGHCHRYLLPLAITANNSLLLPTLLAAGLPLTTSDSDLGLVQLAWLTPDITTWVGMVVTRAVIHRLQAEQDSFLDENGTLSSTILRTCVKNLIEDLNGNEPWGAQFKCPTDISVTQLYVTACRFGGTVTAWYIWKAGASNIDRVDPQNHTALEAALTGRHFVTATRLVLDMKANPFIKGRDLFIPMDRFPDNTRLMEIMLGQEFRNLDKLVAKAKEDYEKHNLQQVILIHIVLFLQYSSDDECQDKWKSFLDIILNAYSKLNWQEISYSSDEWMAKIEDVLVNEGVNGLKFKPITSVEAEILDIDKQIGLNACFKKYSFDNLTDHFYSLLFLLRHNFSHHKISEGGNFMCKSGHKDLLTKSLKITCESEFPLFLHCLISIGQMDVESTLNDICKTRPLHHAAIKGNLYAVEYLLQHTASPFIADRSGILPIHYAFMYGHNSTGNVLLKCMPGSNGNYHTGNVDLSFLDSHREYLRLYGLNHASDNDSRYKHVGTYDNLLGKRLTCIKKEWKVRGVKRSVEGILVNYQSGEAKEIKESVTKLLMLLKNKISEENRLFEGDIKFVGSSEDNVRLFCPDEYDCNLLLQNVTGHPGGELEATLVDLPVIEATHCGHNQAMRVCPLKEDLKYVLGRSRFINKFYSLARKSLTELNLEQLNGLKIMMPGIRRTQVGIALSAMWLGREYPMLFVDIDFVPTVRAPWPQNLPKPKCSIEICHLENVYLNNIGKDEWRLSFGLAETEIMKNLSKGRRDVFLACKMILAGFKTEAWVPQKIKNDFMYWDSRMFGLPSKGGFTLKNSFFRELEETPNDEDWTREYIKTRVCSVFERMCQMGEASSSQGSHEISPASILGTKPVKAYFGGDTEKPSIFLCAPEILKFLRRLDDSIFTKA